MMQPPRGSRGHQDILQQLCEAFLRMTCICSAPLFRAKALLICLPEKWEDIIQTAQYTLLRNLTGKGRRLIIFNNHSGVGKTLRKRDVHSNGKWQFRLARIILVRSGTYNFGLDSGRHRKSTPQTGSIHPNN